jgi:macrolide transport system ATP-binding/permease protein
MNGWNRRKGGLEEEIQQHIDFETQENIESGMSAEKARQAAMRKFGNVTAAQDGSREIWGWLWLERLWQDLSFSLRMLLKSPGFTLVAILTLALGIGANTAIFTLVHAVLLKSLPVVDPKTLIRIGDNNDCCISGGTPDNQDYGLFSTETWRLIKKNVPEFEELAAMQAGFGYQSITTRRDGDQHAAHPAVGEFVSGNYFRTFGLQSQAGRLLTDTDDVAGAPPMAVMSYEAWQRDYAGDRSIVGSTFWINTKAVTVAGIAPKGFFGDRLLSTPPDFYLPIESISVLKNAPYLDDPDSRWLYLVGRVRSGVHLPALQQRLSTMVKQSFVTSKRYTGDGGREQLAKVHVVLTPGGSGIQNMQEEYGSHLRFLMIASGLVLLIACANIANLLLVRGMNRKMEMSLRTALGAARSRIICQLLTESVLLSALGGFAGLVVAYVGTRMLLTLAFPGADKVPIHATPSLPVLAFAFGLSLLTGVLFGIAPAWIASHSEPAEVLRSGSRTTTSGASFLQRGLVILQAALSLVLLVGAGLFSHSLNKLQGTDMKLDAKNRYIVHFDSQAAGYSQKQLEPLYRAMEQRFHMLPGVTKVGISSYTPMEDDNWSDGVQVKGKSDPHVSASIVRANSEYFDSVGTRVVMGRGFTENDTPNSPTVAVVNQEFVKKLFSKGENPIGHHFGYPGPVSSGDYEIVGVVEDTTYQSVRWKEHLMCFFPLMQRAASDNTPIELDTSLYAGAIVLATNAPVSNMEKLAAQTLSAINPNLTVIKFQTFGDQIADRFSEDRMIARLTELFGALALLLAALGLYGVTAYSVARRTSEIGIRMALGAERGGVIAMVMRGAMIQIALGLAIGVPVAWLCVGLIEAQLYDMKGMDLGVLSISVATLLLAAVIAGLIPARRAASIDPAQALRTE